MIVALNRITETPDALFPGSWVESAGCLRFSAQPFVGPQVLFRTNRPGEWSTPIEVTSGYCGMLWDVVGEIVFQGERNGSKLEFANDGVVQQKLDPDP